jgi:hypothetical protein
MEINLIAMYGMLIALISSIGFIMVLIELGIKNEKSKN